MRNIDLYKYSLFSAICNNFPYLSPKESVLMKYENAVIFLKNDEKSLKKLLQDKKIDFDYIICLFCKASSETHSSIIKWLFTEINFSTNNIYLIGMIYEYLTMIQDFDDSLHHLSSILGHHDLKFIVLKEFIDFLCDVIKEFELPEDQRVSKHLDEIKSNLIAAFLDMKDAFNGIKKTFRKCCNISYITDDVDAYCNKYNLSLAQFLDLPFVDITKEIFDKKFFTACCKNINLNVIELF